MDNHGAVTETQGVVNYIGVTTRCCGPTVEASDHERKLSGTVPPKSLISTRVPGEARRVASESVTPLADRHGGEQTSQRYRTPQRARAPRHFPWSKALLRRETHPKWAFLTHGPLLRRPRPRPFSQSPAPEAPTREWRGAKGAARGGLPGTGWPGARCSRHAARDARFPMRCPGRAVRGMLPGHPSPSPCVRPPSCPLSTGASRTTGRRPPAAQRATAATSLGTYNRSPGRTTRSDKPLRRMIASATARESSPSDSASATSRNVSPSRTSTHGSPA
ncbi:hypothetical protein Nocox_31360 [Nonomuraea coxensis DSM 45129]|uniref:Uncharacterized protein n=1 Tax=Nonomuraea coxensis DSM 45129 TaxID=1122611 RepID=A0ABX8U827_9ACTN|nr:hypothetical protein Nocox_31360 [Nonomuraea coxensis DSM 45129]